MKATPMLESEIKILENNLHLTIPKMIEQGLLPGRTYWMIYNTLAMMGYEYDFRKKMWKKTL